MTSDRLALVELIEKGPDLDLLREMIGCVAQRLVDVDVPALCGAGYSERGRSGPIRGIASGSVTGRPAPGGTVHEREAALRELLPGVPASCSRTVIRGHNAARDHGPRNHISDARTGPGHSGPGGRALLRRPGKAEHMMAEAAGTSTSASPGAATAASMRIQKPMRAGCRRPSRGVGCRLPPGPVAPRGPTLIPRREAVESPAPRRA